MSTTKSAPAKQITPNMKIADVLKDHPELLDILLAQSPHFSRLKNPILRRIHGRLVNVAQAATIAGLDPVALVRTLNTAIGHTSPDEKIEAIQAMLTSMEGTPEPPWVGTAVIVARLDVREDQRVHADPFARIMAAVSQVEDGHVLYLRNTFEPLPLYDVLGKRGFVSWARKLGPEDWEIYFLKIGREPSTTERTEGTGQDGLAAATSVEIDANAPTATLTIDVRELTPPQPMMKILDALARLKPGETLLVHHQRQPVHLYPKLAELGYTYRTVEKGPNEVDVFIYVKP